MSISIFDLFSIGIGPSSSHTVGPMRAAKRFLESLGNSISDVVALEITLYGSLAFTGEGHGTTKAIFMGLEGEDPETIDPDTIPKRLQKIIKQKSISLLGKQSINLSSKKPIIQNKNETLQYYSNGMLFKAFAQKENGKDNAIKAEVYYSVGGGFVVTEKEIAHPTETKEKIPFPFDTAAELLAHCKRFIKKPPKAAWRLMFRSVKPLPHGHIDRYIR